MLTALDIQYKSQWITRGIIDLGRIITIDRKSESVVHAPMLFSRIAYLILPFEIPNFYPLSDVNQCRGKN